MALRTAHGPTNVLFGRITLAVFGVIGVAVALAEWSVLPREALLVGAPAIAAALLLDTFLYNEFQIGGGPPLLWLEIYAFVYVEAIVVAAVVRLLRSYWTERVAPDA